MSESPYASDTKKHTANATLSISSSVPVNRVSILAFTFCLYKVFLYFLNISDAEHNYFVAFLYLGVTVYEHSLTVSHKSAEVYA